MADIIVRLFLVIDCVPGPTGWSSLDVFAVLVVTGYELSSQVLRWSLVLVHVVMLLCDKSAVIICQSCVLARAMPGRLLALCLPTRPLPPCGHRGGLPFG